MKSSKAKRRIRPPEVTGLRPSFGPMTGGSIVYVRGEELGTGPDDLVGVTFCGISCADLAWESSTKLRCVTPQAVGSGPVLVTTKSGGIGTCAVEFFFEHLRVEPPEPEQVDIFTEVDVWIEEVAAKPLTAAELQTGHSEEDPLRLGQNAHRRMTTKALKTLGTSDLLEPLLRANPKVSGLLSSPEFDPEFCLVGTYSKTTYEQFKEGLRHLVGTVTEQGRLSRDMVNNSSDTFIGCFETLTEVRDLISRHRAHSLTGDPLHDLEAAVTALLDKSRKAFEPMLRKRRKANKARNVLNVLRSYQFLFHLPKTLRQNIKEEKWLQVIQDYKKAKALFADTQIAVFSRVLEQIEAVASDVRKILYGKLKTLPAALQDQVRVVGYLVEVGVDEDPAWFCLEKQKAFVLKELCAAEEALIQALRRPVETQRGAAQWGKLRIAMRVGRSVSDSSSLVTAEGAGVKVDGGFGRRLSCNRLRQVEATKSLLKQLDRVKTSPQLSFVQHLSRALQDHLPSMWKLGQLCLRRALPEMRDSLGAFDPYNIDEDDDGEGKQLLLQIETMVTTLVDDFVDKCRRVFFEGGTQTGGPVIIGSLTRCEAQIRSCHTTLTALELPEATLSSLTDLLVDFRRHTIDQLFQEATTQTRALVSLEEWKPVGNGMHTRLPELFNTIVQTTFAAVRDMRLDPGSSAVLEDGEQLLCEAMDAFTACLTRLAFEKDEQLGRPSPPQPDRRLMCVMANCLYARRVLAHQVAEQFRQLNLGAVTDLFQEALFELDDLDQRCIDELLRLKSLELTSFLSKATQEDWALLNVAPEKLDVRPYAKNLLLALVVVHAEVAATARPFVHRVLSTLVERLAKELTGQVKHTSDYGPAQRGILQLQLEVFSLKSTLKNYDKMPSVWDAVLRLLHSKKGKSIAPSAEGAGKGMRRALPTPGGGTVRTIPNPGTATRRALPTPGERGGPNVPGKRALPAPGAGRARKPSMSGAPAVAAVAGIGDTSSPLEAPDAVRGALARFQEHTRFQFACFRLPPSREDDFFDDHDIIYTAQEHPQQGRQDERPQQGPPSRHEAEQKNDEKRSAAGGAGDSDTDYDEETIADRPEAYHSIGETRERPMDDAASTDGQEDEEGSVREESGNDGNDDDMV